jgi:hypothetical protein
VSCWRENRIGGCAKTLKKLKGDTFDFHFIDGARKSNGPRSLVNLEDILCNLAVSIPFGSMLILILFYFHLIFRFTKVVNGLSLKESVLLFNPKTFPQNIFSFVEN